MSVSFVPVILRPDLVFGLVGPIGMGIEYIQYLRYTGGAATLAQ
jgi:hypothetical protein